MATARRRSLFSVYVGTITVQKYSRIGGENAPTLCGMTVSVALAFLDLWRLALVGPPTPAPTPVGSSATDPWQIFLGIGAILGAIAAVQQLIAAVAKYRRRKEESRLFQIMKDQLDAEHARSEAQTAKQEADSLSEMREVLRKQIEEDVPREARRLYIEHRLSVLGREIAEQYREYISLQSELNTEVRTQLDERLATVIEETIVPAQVSRSRRERWILALLVAIGLFTFTPFDLQRIFSYYITQPFFIINHSYRFTESAVGWSLAGAILIWTSAIFLLAKIHWVRKTTARFIRAPRAIVRAGLIIGPGASFLLLVAGYFLVADARRAYIGTGNSDWYEAADRAAICFHLASFIVGALVAYGFLSHFLNRIFRLGKKRENRASIKGR
ncbi:hypothetical protein [Nonomuraea sp. NPDC049028]|uniref:hypothetical protein n=1 Tax=Nonomuraea sp. NPDC049028 TaxID=3364348 RepID=UPI00371946D4